MTFTGDWVCVRRTTAACGGGDALSLVIDGDNDDGVSGPNKSWTLPLTALESDDVLYLRNPILVPPCENSNGS